MESKYKVYMSGTSTGSVESDDGTMTTYSFEQSIPIPSYLLALAVGNLEKQALGGRSYVITEPEMMESSAAELVDLDDSLQRAEKFYITYPWDEYAILVLPPSFPYGGMENPLLTFASPTIIVGDKS